MNNIGKKFNRLLVLDVDKEKREEQIQQKKKKIRKYYKCQCDCGNIISIRADAIISGHAKSCGCLRGEKAKENGKQQALKLAGQRFGHLTAIEPDESTSSGTKWICRCDCGKLVSVFTTNLTKLHTTSCGCSIRSIGEQNIETILQEYNINYSKEYSFPDLKDKGYLRFDFAIFDKNHRLIELIEFDGRQHNSENTFSNNNLDTLEDRKRRDTIKEQYCVQHKIKLLRIPYKYRDKITIDLLELEGLV